MGRVVDIQSAATFAPTSYSDNTFTSSYYQNLDNGLNPHDGTNSYARFTLRNTSYHIYYDFSVTDIPEIATINSVTCQVRGYVQNTSYYPSVQLYTNTTAKGSATNITSTSTSNVVNLNVGSWTLSELQNARLYINTVNATTQQSRYFYFYGATLTVNYSVNGTMYEITTSSETDLATIEPASQEIFEGGDGTVKIETDNVGDIVVEDNGTDITNQLVVKTKTPITGETLSLALTNTTTGVSSTATSFYMSSSNQGYTYINLAGGYSAENPNSSLPTGSSVGSYVYVKDGGSNNTTGWIIYSFDFSEIPENASITSVTVKCYGAKEGATTSDSQHVAKIGLYTNDILKSSEQQFTSASNQLITITNPGTWTRSELQNAKLRFTVGYYGGRLGGITWIVNYTIPIEGNPYYYEYTVSNISSDHNVIVSENVIVPPEEDETKTYYSVTVSSINATTDPNKGTTRLESGTSQTITITPTDPQLTLALDNGVNITSQLVQHGGGTPPDPIIETAPNASYGFNLNSSTGYYVSTNQGISSSASVARVNFDFPVNCLVTFQFINYGESTYDFGVFGKLDTTLSTTGWTASNNGGDTTTDAGKEQLRLNTSEYNTSTPQTLTYEIPSGEHYIDIKYGKDQASDDGNDSLQFKITNIEPLEPIVGYYTYDLTNINSNHSLVFIFGDVTYYFITSNTSSDCKLYPYGQIVALPGDAYRLTIVVNKPTDTVSITDNGVDMTSALERKEVETVKEGVSSLTVNYIYRLNNVQTGHTLNILSNSGDALYVKINNSYTMVHKVFKKQLDPKDDTIKWVEQNISRNIFDTTKIYKTEKVTD